MAGSEADDDDTESSSEIVVIADDGELLLDAVDEKAGQTFTYRIDIARVQKSSAYFERLLDPRKFGEGALVASQLDALKKKHGQISKVPTRELPRIKISDVGKTSKLSSIKLLLRDFLKVLHGQDIISSPTASSTAAMPLANVANLAVVADRFDALEHTAAYIRRKRVLENIDARSKVKAAKAPEERLRQRLLVGSLFDHASWTMSASQALIVSGSARWKADAPVNDDLPLWWDLSRGVEDELITRRDYAVDTLQSIALHFVGNYTSGTQQCRLGYANSGACDSFQLGEMIKFFKKNNLIKLGPVLTGQDEAESYGGDLERIIDIYKSCPSRQIDDFHTHCGLRTRLIPLIEQLEVYFRSGFSVGLGICGDCWRAHRSAYAWSSAKRPVAWSAPIPRITASARSPGSDACLSLHTRLRDMFMAVDRDFTPKEERSEGIRFGRSTPFLKYD